MNICKKCGYQNTGYTKFCIRCGTVYDNSASSPNMNAESNRVVQPQVMLKKSDICVTRTSMNVIVRFKLWNARRKRLIGIRKHVERGVFVDAEERELFITKNKRTPEQHKAIYDKKQADIAEKQRITALDRTEKKHSFPGLFLRTDKDGMYYFGNSFSEVADRQYLVDFQWAGPSYNVISRSVTTGKDKHSSNAGKAVVGGLLFGPLGAVAGATSKRNTKVNHQTVTTSEQVEINTTAILVFVNARTREKTMQTVTCNSRLAKGYTSLRYTSL